MKLADFGLVRSLDESDMTSQSGNAGDEALDHHMKAASYFVFLCLFRLWDDLDGFVSDHYTGSD